jgi:cobyrinic acid a,c-diamide synthase
VQAFKIGPDFIDPLHHQRASGRASRNLDGWMLSREANMDCFARGSADADVAVVEGVMGLFDGSEGKSDRGSTAEMSKLLGLPILLVVDASAMARSAAALIHGFASFDPELHLAGVILNKVGGPVHADMIRDAMAEGVPVLGAIPRVAELVVPERHLGLHLPHEARDDYVDQLATLTEEYVDVDELLQVGRIERPQQTKTHRVSVAEATVRIGLARDEAFCFYYADNLELLEQAGAELVEFSPIRNPLPDDLDGLYFGGGYPELHASQLAENTVTIDAVREFAASGGPIYAECGGLMYLAETLELEGTAYPFCGILPFNTRMPAGLTLSYVQIETTGGLFGPGLTARGHLYHQSEICGEAKATCCYKLQTNRGDEKEEGYSVGNVLASYAHLHFASQSGIADAFIKRCREHRS